jgi:type I restriction enzyme S subunit
MFIDNVSETWKTGALSDIATITMGQSPKGDTFNESKDGTVFYQGRTDFGFRFPQRRLYTTEPKRLAKCGDVLMSVRAPVGDLNVAYENCCIGRGLASVRSNSNHQSFVLYTMFALKNKLDVFNGEGTVFGSINKDSLNSMEITIPPIELIDKFETTVSIIDKLILKNYEEICRLQAIRDSLLPKLMSGEIDVSNVQI